MSMARGALLVIAMQQGDDNMVLRHFLLGELGPEVMPDRCGAG
jgi:hypothetical protein